MNAFDGRNLVVLILCLFNIKCGLAAMTEKQVAAAAKLLRNMCMPKTKATLDDIDKMHQGDWNIDHTAMITKENKFDRAAAMTQINMLPVSMREYVITCIDQCENAAVTLDDKCVASFELAKCLYDCNPEKYFLP